MCETYAEQKDKKQWDTLIREHSKSDAVYSLEQNSPAEIS